MRAITQDTCNADDGAEKSDGEPSLNPFDSDPVEVRHRSTLRFRDFIDRVPHAEPACQKTGGQPYGSKNQQKFRERHGSIVAPSPQRSAGETPADQPAGRRRD